MDKHSRNKSLKSSPRNNARRATSPKNRFASQTKPPKKSSSRGFFHTTKGKVISIIVGLLVLGGVGVGVWVGIFSGNSSSESTTDKYKNLNDVQERNLYEKLNQLNDDYKDALIAFIISKNSLKTRSDLINKNFDGLKKEVFDIFDNKLSSETESFDDLLIALQLVTFEAWTTALNQLDSNQSLATIIVSNKFTEVNNQPLTSQLMEQFDLVDKLPKLISGVTIKYSHSSLDHNGELSLTLNVTIGSNNPINKELLFTIQGLDLVNAKDYISRLLPKESVIEDRDILSIEEDTIFLPALAQKYFKDSYNQPRGVIIKYTHSGLTQDGDLLFNFKIIENDSNEIETIIKKIPIVGINQGKAKTYLQTLIPKNYTSENDAPNARASGTLEGDIVNKFFDFSGGQSYQPPAHVSIAYQVSPITNSQYTITFTITNNQQSLSREVTLTINYFIGDSIIVSAASYLNSLHKKTLTKTEDISSVLESEFGDTEVERYFEDDSNLPDDVDITYWHDGLTHDGDLVLNIRIKKNEQSKITLTFNIPVVGIDQGKAKTYLESLTPKQLTKTTDISALIDETTFSSSAATEYFQETYIPPTGVTITYSHDGLTQDGDLVLNFKIKKDNQVDVKTSINIPVRGIELGKTKTLLQSLFPTGRTVVVHASSIPAHGFKNIDDDLFNLIKQNKPNFPSNVDIQYKITNTLNVDGELSIGFQLKKRSSSSYTQIPAYQINVEGINVRKARDIINGLTKVESLELSLKTSLNAISKQKFENDSELDLNIFYFEGNVSYKDAFKEAISSVEVEVLYSHDAIDQNGEVTFTLTIRKGKAEENLEIQINVIGVYAVKGLIYLESLTHWEIFDSTSVPEYEIITSANAGKYFDLKGRNYEAPQGVSISTNPTSAINGGFYLDISIEEVETGVVVSFGINYKLKS